MSFRFWRRKKVAPGVTLNMSKSGMSVSLGPPGAKVTLGSRGTQVTFGLPGTGMFWTKRLPPITELLQRPEVPEVPESDWSLALAHLNRGAIEEAQAQLENVDHADADWLKGVIALGRDEDARAEAHLRAAWDRRGGLGLAPNASDLAIEVPIAHEVSFALKADPLGTAIALAEAIQGQGRPGDALDVLGQVTSDEPTLALAQADLAIELAQFDDAEAWLDALPAEGPEAALAALLRERIRTKRPPSA